MRKSIAIVIGAGGIALALSFAANQLHGVTVSSAAGRPTTTSFASVVTGNSVRAELSAARIASTGVAASRDSSSIARAGVQRGSFALAHRNTVPAGRHGAYASTSGACHHQARVTGGS